MPQSAQPTDEAEWLAAALHQLEAFEQVAQLMLVLSQGGVKPEPDDPGMMGWVARTLPDVNMRVFPKGGLWWALLDALRAIDGENGGA